MKLSIVTTMYRSAPYIEEFCRRAVNAAKSLVGDDYEVVLVNDGSPDNCFDMAEHIVAANPNVTLVDLSRNFGHHKAMMTGLKYARGDQVFLIDCDLEEEPEWLIKFAGILKESGADVVYGVQAKRRGDWFERITGNLFYSLFRVFSNFEIPRNAVTARLMRRRYVDALLQYRESELNIFGLFVLAGFDQRSETVAKHSSSPTTYSLARKFSLFVNSLTSFSSLPLVFTFYSGLVISLSALMYIAFLLFKFFADSSVPSGYTSLIISIWLFSGLIIFFIGVQGIYIAKVFSEVKARPFSIVREVRQSRSEASGRFIGEEMKP